MTRSKLLARTCPLSVVSAAAVVVGLGFATPGAALSPTDVGILQAGPSRVAIGDVIDFKLSAYNSGPGTLPIDSGARVTAELPASFTQILVSGDHWICRVEALKIGCTYSGAKIPPGQSFPVITIQARAIAGGTYSNCVHIRIQSTPANVDHIDQAPGNNDVCISGTIIQGTLEPQIQAPPRRLPVPPKN